MWNAAAFNRRAYVFKRPAPCVDHKLLSLAVHTCYEFAMRSIKSAGVPASGLCPVAMAMIIMAAPAHAVSIASFFSPIRAVEAAIERGQDPIDSKYAEASKIPTRHCRTLQSKSRQFQTCCWRRRRRAVVRITSRRTNTW
jgi:hypothetical protein